MVTDAEGSTEKPRGELSATTEQRCPHCQNSDIDFVTSVAGRFGGLPPAEQ